MSNHSPENAAEYHIALPKMTQEQAISFINKQALKPKTKVICVWGKGEKVSTRIPSLDKRHRVISSILELFKEVQECDTIYIPISKELAKERISNSNPFANFIRSDLDLKGI